jgi:hypothetical protein
MPDIGGSLLGRVFSGQWMTASRLEIPDCHGSGGYFHSTRDRALIWVGWTVKATKSWFKPLSLVVSAKRWNTSGWFPPMSSMLSLHPRSWTPLPSEPLPSFSNTTHEHVAVADGSPVYSL